MTDSSDLSSKIQFVDETLISQSPCAEHLRSVFTADTNEARLDALHQYIAEFDIWLDAALAAAQPSTIEVALVCHEKVIALTKEWLETQAKELSAHKQKSKVIMAYADTLPRRLSRYRPLKG